MGPLFTTYTTSSLQVAVFLRCLGTEVTEIPPPSSMLEITLFPGDKVHVYLNDVELELNCGKGCTLDDFDDLLQDF
jgi:hypothetical protein